MMSINDYRFTTCKRNPEMNAFPPKRQMMAKNECFIAKSKDGQIKMHYH
jgi:hypothetical protein